MKERLENDLAGQWVGDFSGQLAGTAVLSIERDCPTKGFLAVVQPQPLPPSRINLTITSSNRGFRARSESSWAFDKNTRSLLPADEYVQKHPDVFFPQPLDVNAEINGNSMTGTWNCGTGQHGTFALKKTLVDEPAQADFPQMSWKEFKVFIGDHIAKRREMLYRGQNSNGWRLVTSFHRHGRYDLAKYRSREVTELVRRVNAGGNRRYNLESRADDLGSLLSLAQHHGFPTPLLDWTKSPYIAAYFAFEKLPRDPDGCPAVRIYLFDAEQWASDTYQSSSLYDPNPSVCVREFEPEGNPRHLPQQSAHLFSNVEDVEGWIRRMGSKKGKQYLTTVDIAASERQLVMRELAFMGVTAAALFPSLDGVCDTLRERFFNW